MFLMVGTPDRRASGWASCVLASWPMVIRPGLAVSERPPREVPPRKKMIMTLQARDKVMSLADVSEMLGIPVHTLYRWRNKGDGPVGYRVGRHVRYRREAVEAWLEQHVDQR